MWCNTVCQCEEMSWKYLFRSICRYRISLRLHTIRNRMASSTVEILILSWMWVFLELRVWAQKVLVLMLIIFTDQAVWWQVEMGHSLLAGKRYFTGMFKGIQNILFSQDLFDRKFITLIYKNQPFYGVHHLDLSSSDCKTINCDWLYRMKWEQQQFLLSSWTTISAEFLFNIEKFKNMSHQCSWQISLAVRDDWAASP